MPHDNYRIDGHKLMLHPRRVADWLDGKDIAPLYMEVSPSGACNHRCVFCGMDFLGYQPRFLPTEKTAARLREWGNAGLKAIMFAGEGEPFLHKDMPRLAIAAKSSGIDVAFTTNGVLMTPEKAEAVLPATTWIKMSCNAGSPESYARIHQTQPEDFSRALANMEAAVQLRTRHGWGCTLGIQMLLLPENREEAVSLTHRAADMGVDYLVIKPYSVHRQSTKNSYKDLHYGDCNELQARLEECNRPGFKVVFRQKAMARREAGSRPYGHCLSLPFWGYVDSSGNVWGCLRHIGEEVFLYGNFLTDSVADILNGPARSKAIHDAASTLDISDCQVDCRMDPANAWLWELTHPNAHVNFI